MSLIIDLSIQKNGFDLSIKTEIPSTGFNAIYGHSGAGKTTLLRWLAGLEPSSQGYLEFKKQCWQNSHVFIPTQQREIAYVFQDARLFPHLCVYENLFYAYKRRFNNNGPSIEHVCQWFELQDLLAHHTDQLSGGQQQKVAMARALLSSPQLILMDEPLASLDSNSKNRIIQHLEQLQHHLQIPIIYISHSIEEISRLADYLLLLKQGQIHAQGNLLELSSRLDLSINHEENAASIIEAKVYNHDHHYHLTELKISDLSQSAQSIFLTRNNNQPGENVRIRIPARDVSICLNKTLDSSILNILSCTIDDIEKNHGSCVLIRLKLAEQCLLARLTHKSLDRLQLQVGQVVYAQIKTVALLNDQGNNSSYEANLPKR